MISAIVYGRNDAHGYNLHRRVALSLNCLAEVLTDPADEIIFVDYNTPDELPTVIEALADTLTQRCLSLLRVLRVPASLHTERYGGRTHLAVVEPVARNVAARRANPSNRWLLSTNTDMIFVPLQGQSLSDTCRDLSDGFYALPRFEIPEWVWERLPRADPQRTLAELEHLGPGLYLNEQTRSYKWIRFDAPGDFQLMLRDDLVAIDGFDEEMLLGWHVDSNLSRRLFLLRGAIETLEDSVAGYHCNHVRIPTVLHSAEKTANDLARFFYSVEDAPLPAQRATWGLADTVLEEVPLELQIGPMFVDAMLATLPEASSPRPSSDATKAAFGTTYDTGHVLPFIADSLVVSPLTTIGYLGINPILQRMLGRLLYELGVGCDLRTGELTDTNDVDELASSADLFVVDFGTDLSLAPTSNGDRFGEESDDIPLGLDLVFAALDRLVDVERARLGLGAHPRRIVLVNSSTVFLDTYVSAQFHSSSTTFHSRVRRATVKASVDDEATVSGLQRARALARWALRRGGDSGSMRVVPGEAVRLADLVDYSGLVTGWALPDDTGVWTLGSRSELRIAFPAVKDGDWSLALMIDAVCVPSDETLPVALFVDGIRVATRDCSQLPFVWRVEFPAGALPTGNALLTITIDEPFSPLAVGWTTDERPLGVHLRSLTLGEVDRSVQSGRSVLFVEGTNGDRLLGEGWSMPEPTGVWTEGHRARLDLALGTEPHSEAELVLNVAPFVTPEHAKLTVDVWALDTRLARRVYRYGDGLGGTLVLRLPPSVRDETGRTVIDFHLDDPVRPVDLGMGSDARRLGLHLSSLTLDGRLTVHAGETTDFTQLTDFAGFSDGWALGHDNGIWTQGHRSVLALALEGVSEADHRLVLSITGVSIALEDTPSLELLTNGVRASVSPLTPSNPRFIWKVDLPADVMAAGEADLTFVTPERPSSVAIDPISDVGQLGICIGAIGLEEVDRSLAVGQTVSFIKGSDAERFLADGWSWLEPTGVWTTGRRARIIFRLGADLGKDLELVLGGYAYVAPEHPEVEVVFTAHGEMLGVRRFRHSETNSDVRIPLGGVVEDTQGRVVVDLEIDHPMSPKDLGASRDARHLGLHLQWLMVRRAGIRGQWDAVKRRLGRADPFRQAGEPMSTTRTSASTLFPVTSRVSD
jgi:hypothetical protein